MTTPHSRPTRAKLLGTQWYRLQCAGWAACWRPLAKARLALTDESLALLSAFTIDVDAKLRALGIV